MGSRTGSIGLLLVVFVAVLSGCTQPGPAASTDPTRTSEGLGGSSSCEPEADLAEAELKTRTHQGSVSTAMTIILTLWLGSDVTFALPCHAHAANLTLAWDDPVVATAWSLGLSGCVQGAPPRVEGTSPVTLSVTAEPLQQNGGTCIVVVEPANPARTNANLDLQWTASVEYWAAPEPVAGG